MLREHEHQKTYSPYLVRTLLQSVQSEDLYSYVKFGLLADTLAQRKGALRILDLGCGPGAAKKALESRGLAFEYAGVDREAAFQPEITAELRNLEQHRPAILRREANTILLLDVLEHLDGCESEIRQVLRACRRLCTSGARLIVMVPQNYRLDQFKLAHLHYAEHTVRMTRDEWASLLSEQFRIREVYGVGYLSSLPYLLMALPFYKDSNWVGQAFRFLRNRAMNQPWLKRLDLFLCQSLRSKKFCLGLANDICFELDAPVREVRAQA